MKLFYIVIIYALSMVAAKAQPSSITFQSAVSSGSGVVDLAFDPANRMHIIKQNGSVQIYNGSSILATPFLNMSADIKFGGEQGLLSLAFHPQYATNGYFFVYYNAVTTGNITIARYQRDAVNPDIADPSTKTVIFNLSKGPDNETNHNGGKLNFGPDGYLYVGIGDGGGGGDPNNYAQTGTNLLGKMIRIDVNGFATATPFYAIPPTNPYIADAAVNDEVLALGVRNPWRWSFDKSTGDMWLADVGQGAWEEVNFRAAADLSNPGNYGWRCFEASAVYNACGTPLANLINPIFEYGHNAAGGYSITGGYVYRGSEYVDFMGWYICADYVSGNGWLIKNNGGGSFTSTPYTGWPSNVTTFGQNNNGDLYAAAGSTIYKITASGPLPIRLISFTGKLQNNNAVLNWNVQNEKAGDLYTLESANASMSFSEVYSITALQTKQANSYSYSVLNTSNNYYRLKMIGADGKITYSPVINLNNKTKDIKVQATANGINVQSTATIKSIEITDVNGRRLLTKTINASGYVNIVFAATTGIYIVKVADDAGNITAHKLFK